MQGEVVRVKDGGRSTSTAHHEVMKWLSCSGGKLRRGESSTTGGRHIAVAHRGRRRRPRTGSRAIVRTELEGHKGAGRRLPADTWRRTNPDQEVRNAPSTRRGLAPASDVGADGAASPLGRYGRCDSSTAEETDTSYRYLGHVLGLGSTATGKPPSGGVVGGWDDAGSSRPSEFPCHLHEAVRPAEATEVVRARQSRGVRPPPTADTSGRTGHESMRARLIPPARFGSIRLDEKI